MQENPPQAQTENGFFRFFSALDIFAFLPVPISREVSTKRSIVASVLLIVLFLAYVIYGTYKLLTNNPPKTNQYYKPIPETMEVETPQFAIVFMTGENLNISFYDESYFTFKLQQVTIYKDINKPRVYDDLPLVPCKARKLPWMKKNNFKDLLCPSNTSQTIMRGLIYSSEVHKFPRIQIALCKNETENSTVQCATENEISDKFSKGRIFLFVARPGGVNFATETHSPEDFTMLYYFLVPGFYNRAELSIRKNTYIVRPDYLSSFTTKEFSTFTQVGEKIYMSKTPNPSLLFLIWMRLDQEEEYNEMVFMSSIDTISMWGALWGVLFSLCAFYFLKYNRRRFYQKKPSWSEFDEEFERLKRKKLKRDDESATEKEEEEEKLQKGVDEKERKII